MLKKTQVNNEIKKVIKEIVNADCFNNNLFEDGKVINKKEPNKGRNKIYDNKLLINNITFKFYIL